MKPETVELYKTLIKENQKKIDLLCTQMENVSPGLNTRGRLQNIKDLKRMSGEYLWSLYDAGKISID